MRQDKKMTVIALKLFQGEQLEAIDFIPHDSLLDSYISFAAMQPSSQLSLDQIHAMVSRASEWNIASDVRFPFMALFSFYFIGFFVRNPKMVDQNFIESLANSCASSLMKQGARAVEPVLIHAFAIQFYREFQKASIAKEMGKQSQKVLGWC